MVCGGFGGSGEGKVGRVWGLVGDVSGCGFRDLAGLWRVGVTLVQVLGFGKARLDPAEVKRACRRCRASCCAQLQSP